MSEPDEDFAAMFEASLKAKRFEKGQTIEGTIVAIGPEVAFVDVGGKGEATIEIDELKDADGRSRGRRRRPHPGDGGVDRGRADALAEAGARRRDRAAARRRVPHRSAGGRQGRTGGEGRLRGAHRAASAPSARSLRSTPSGRDPAAHEGQRLRIPDHRVQGRRQEPRRLAACAARGGAARERRRGPAIDRRRRGDDRARRLRARVRRVRRSGRRRAGPAARLRDGVVPRVGPVAGRQARRGDHRQGPARRRRQAEDLARVEAAHRRSVVESARRPTRSARCAPAASRALAEFGAFVELEPGVEGLAHASTFAPTGRSDGWSALGRRRG